MMCVVSCEFNYIVNVVNNWDSNVRVGIFLRGMF